MVVHSAGILLHRPGPDGPQVLLGHMGGPFWARKDDGAWSGPKGEHDPDEEPLAAARREFAEELGSHPPAALGRGVSVETGAGTRAGPVRAVCGSSDVTARRTPVPPRSTGAAAVNRCPGRRTGPAGR